MQATSTSTSPVVCESELVPLARATDRASAGAKAATLAALIARGHRVPDGFVIPTSACARTDGALGDGMRRALAQALAALGHGPVAVRSSAVGEDGAEASFAGQLATELDVRGIEDLCGAVVRCVAAASAARARAYRDALAPSADLAIAILVQRMVPAEAAGVAFTVNPATGDEEVVVNAVSGLGEALVSGEATPEEWSIRGGSVERAPSSPRALAEADALAVAALAEGLAVELGAPQDVEWALADGELYLLQSRPITAAPLPPRFEDPTSGTWMRDQVHYPTGMTAFGGSTYLPILDRATSAMAAEFGLLIEGLESYWRSGEIYGRVIPPGGKEGAPPPWWLLAVLSRVVPFIRTRMRAAEHALAPGRMDQLVRRWNEHGRADFERRVRALAIDLDALDDPALLAHLDRVLALLEDGQRLHFQLVMPYVLATHRFVVAAEAVLGWDARRAIELLAGSSRTSAAPSRELEAIAARVRALGGAVDAVCGADDPLAALRSFDAALADELAGWLERWGLRASSYDLGAPTLAEQPGLLLGLVREALARDPDERAAPGAEALARAENELAGRADRARFDQALAHAREVFPIREDNVLYTDNLVCGLGRRAALAIGRRLCARGLLARAEHVVELHVDEARAALRGEHAGTAELARRRARERAWVAAHPGPALLRGSAAPPPDVRGLPAAGRTINHAFLWIMSHEYPESTGATRAAQAAGSIRGIGAWPGRYEGTVRVVRGDTGLARVRRGDVLVASVTTPAWSIVFGRIGALVTDEGGILSHAAIVAREHGIPTVLATGDATTRLRDGQRVIVDGSDGTVTTL